MFAILCWGPLEKALETVTDEICVANGFLLSGWGKDVTLLLGPGGLCQFPAEKKENALMCPLPLH